MLPFQGVVTISLSSSIPVGTQTHWYKNVKSDAQNWKALSSETLFLDTQFSITRNSTILQTSSGMKPISAKENKPFYIGTISSYVARPLTSNQRNDLKLTVSMFLTKPADQSFSLVIPAGKLIQSLADQKQYLAPSPIILNGSTYHIKITATQTIDQATSPFEKLDPNDPPAWRHINLIASLVPA
ncbi:hypothetical protein JD969_08845 [Planctomycetota bacterium]|nr:hypothetical protein JD969_08845 [Planctomycetota bacterium]